MIQALRSMLEMRPRATAASFMVAAVSLVLAVPQWSRADGPETVVVHSGSALLRGLLWRPSGRGPFPSILLNHGSGRTPEELKRLGPYEKQAYTLGPVFVRHGYELLFLCRRGVGLSRDQGPSAIDLMTAEVRAHGLAGRNAVQLELLEGRELGDARAGLAFLRARPEVDSRRLATVGHSFGGSLTLLLTEVEHDLRAAVVFSGVGYSWDRSPGLRQRLLAAEDRAAAPVFFIHAANDYSLDPGRALDDHLRELGRSHRLEIYPPVGTTADEGHAILYLAVGMWERDVFAFLDQHVRP